MAIDGIESGKSSASTSKQDVASRRSETMDLEEEHEEEEILLPNTNIITHCIYKNLPQRIIKCFEDDTDKFKEQALECLNKRDADGKSPLDIAAQLGRLEITRELLARGADVNSFTPKGYSCLHYAAAWGRMKVLRLHVENGGNVTQRNAHGERPRETAERYSQEECVLYLDWAEAKHLLSEAIKATQESILEADKAVAGRISKDEKNIILNTCKEKMEWLETTQDASTQDFISHRIALTEITAPILLKLSEPDLAKVVKAAHSARSVLKTNQPSKKTSHMSVSKKKSCSSTKLLRKESA